MNEKTRIQIEEMKKQTIGVEVEMYNITREKAARTIAEYFHTEGTVKYIGGSYSAWACKDNKGREWKITRDSSIQAASDDEKAELGTPILTYEDIPDLQEILRQLRHKGAKSDPAHMCGVHIHIGANGHTPQTLRNLANIMASHESLLAEALKLDTNRSDIIAERLTRTFWSKSIGKDLARWQKLSCEVPCIHGCGICWAKSLVISMCSKYLWVFHRSALKALKVRRNRKCLKLIGPSNMGTRSRSYGSSQGKSRPVSTVKA